jgi:gonadotropin-releasing hormone receptor
MICLKSRPRNLVDRLKNYLTCLLLQIVIFHVERHPKVTWYEQCVAFNMFPTKLHELSYRVLGMAMMYGLPLVVIIISYACIIAEILRRYQLSLDGTLPILNSSSLHTVLLSFLIFALCLHKCRRN